MPRTRTAALSLAAILTAASAFGQGVGMPIPGLPMGGGANMTPEQAREMADRMMQQMGGAMGLDPETLRNATPEQRREMLKGAADAMAGQMQQRLEQSFGMPLDQVEKLGEDELRALMATRHRPPMPAFEPTLLRPAPASGFPDGAMPLPVRNGNVASLSFEMAQGDVLLVVADTARQEILLNETRTTPLEEEIDLDCMARDTGALVVEIIDPRTHRVIRRYRPVAAE